MLKSYLKYQVRAQGIYRIHSPFVFGLISEVLKDRRSYYAYAQIEKLRASYLADNRTVELLDFGAGKRSGQKGNKRKIKEIAARAGSPSKVGQLLFRMVNQFQPETVLELGTSLGIGTHYLAAAKPSSRLISLEGSPEIAAIAQTNLVSSGLANVEVRVGDFSKTLASAASDLGKIDFVFMDGNHRMEPSISYFDIILPHLHEDSVVILDDIHWSSGMELAWEELKKRSEVCLSIDLFRLGLLFFRSENRQKSSFILRW